MTYYGLQPLLSNDNLPSILKSSIGLYLSNSNYLLPCVFNNIDINNEYLIPSHPIDTNQIVGDTVIRKPTTISLELYVYEEKENEFHSILKQGITRGFYFVNRTKTLYDNLYITSKSLNFSSERYGGFSCSLELQEVLKVTSLESIRALPTQSQRKDSGQVSAPKAKQETVQQFNNKSILKELSGGSITDIIKGVFS